MQIKRLLASILLLLPIHSFGQVLFSRITQINQGVPYWVAFTNNLDSGSWDGSTVLSVSGVGCTPAVTSSYFKGANPPFNHQEIMAIVDPGDCGSGKILTFTDSVYHLTSTMTVRTPLTYYIRTDGGSRYDASTNPSGQCSGNGDQSYAAAGGSGVNQNCAWGDLRLLWVTAFTYDASPESMFNFVAIAGGDTVIVRGGHSDSTSWRIGQDGPNSGDYFFLAGDNRETWMPSLPWGTVAQPLSLLNFWVRITPLAAILTLHMA